MKNTTNPDLLRTAKLPACSMRDLVYPRAAKRFPLPTRLIFLAAFLGATIGCAHLQPAPVADAPETVGNLSASYHSVVVAPLKHDAPPELGQVIDTDEEAPAPVTVSRAVDGGGDAELPETTGKAAHGF